MSGDILFSDTARRVRTRNRKWTPEQDKKLFMLVTKHGNNFNLIAKHFTNKLAKSCRQRWINQIDPSINREPFSPQQEWLLFLGVTFYGTKWTEIESMFINRPAKHIKNYWNTTRMKNKLIEFKNIVQQVFLAKGLEQIRKKMKPLQ